MVNTYDYETVFLMGVTNYQMTKLLENLHDPCWFSVQVRTGKPAKEERITGTVMPRYIYIEFDSSIIVMDQKHTVEVSCVVTR